MEGMSPFLHPYLEKFLRGGGGEPIESYAIALGRLQIHPFQ